MIYGGYFDTDQKIKRINELEDFVNTNNIWDNREEAEKIILEMNTLKDSVQNIKDIKKEVEDNLDIVSLLEEEMDNELFSSLESSALSLKEKIDKLEIELLLNKEYDNKDCILEVHSGAGGTEACDWAMMLFRMYNRYAERHGFKTEVLDYQDGDTAGIKRASILIKGSFAYGYLKAEKGVHRLVRLSPFDANNKRHTSFASVEVTPIFDKNIDIEIKDEDLKIDVFHSGGAGGQSVNTTDSAVRITHLPTKIVVTCQNERSQLQNKEKALEILKNKLKLIEIEKQEEELAKVKGESKNIEFGSQIRSYVMHPYSMVKDHRTNIETSNVTKVLDGDLDMFIEGYLRRG